MTQQYPGLARRARTLRRSDQPQRRRAIPRAAAGRSTTPLPTPAESVTSIMTDLGEMADLVGDRVRRELGGQDLVEQFGRAAREVVVTGSSVLRGAVDAFARAARGAGATKPEPTEQPKPPKPKKSKAAKKSKKRS